MLRDCLTRIQILLILFLLSWGAFSPVLGESTLRIVAPKDDSEVGFAERVKGKVSDPKLSVYVLVLSDTSWWPQDPTDLENNGNWDTTVHFGENEAHLSPEKKGIGKRFKVLAITAPKGKLTGELKKGKPLTMERIQDLP